MRERAMGMVLLVAKCNRREERSRGLVELCALVEEFKVLVNLGKEVAAFQSFKQFAQ